MALYRNLNDLSYLIINCFFEVHNKLGQGLLEKCYHNALCYVLGKKGLIFDSEKIFPVIIDNFKVSEYKADIVVENKIIVEVKAVSKLLPIHQAQIINYLKISGLPIGLLVNFANERAYFRRFINNK